MKSTHWLKLCAVRATPLKGKRPRREPRARRNSKTQLGACRHRPSEETSMTAPDVPPPAPDRKVVDFPQTSDDAVRRQVAEAERLANFSPAEVLLWAPSSAER